MFWVLIRKITWLSHIINQAHQFNQVFRFPFLSQVIDIRFTTHSHTHSIGVSSAHDSCWWRWMKSSAHDSTSSRQVQIMYTQLELCESTKIYIFSMNIHFFIVKQESTANRDRDWFCWWPMIYVYLYAGHADYLLCPEMFWRVNVWLIRSIFVDTLSKACQATDLERFVYSAFADRISRG